jgi:agmatine/peptidylarginine deiminase
MNKFIIFFIFFAIISQSQAQQNKSEDLNKSLLLKEKISKLTPEQFKQKLQQVNQRIPNFKTNFNLPKATAPKNANITDNSLQFISEFPKQVTYPGEFEEVQAILMTWPYVTFDTTGEITDQVFENIGTYYNSITNEYSFGPVYSIIDTFEVSPYPQVFSKLAYDINLETQVWITLWSAEDTTTLKNYMQKIGMPLTNYKFFIIPGNSFWYRDCGPVAFYYGQDDKIGFLDLEYYGGRPLDDAVPSKLAEAIDIPNYSTSIEYEGGNILLDGLGNLISSNAVYLNNLDTCGLWFLGDDGQIYEIQKKALKTTQVDDSLKYLFNLNSLKVLPALHYDGGTGHVDLYVDMWDENRFVFSQYPTEMKNFTDYLIVSKNIDTLLSITRSNGKKYTKSYIPFPKKDDGTWYKNNNDYANYTRSYSNHLFVNKAIIQPVFADESTGDINGTKNDLQKISEAYPGYKIYPIDIRSFDGDGGAIHCITKQIPADNPIRIYHTPIDEIVKTESHYTLNATIQNKSGIADAKVFWRYKDDANWNSENFSPLGNDNFQAVINNDKNSGVIEYYIQATSNNGKTITKPMTAPNGFYSFNFNLLSVKEENFANEKIGEFFPNPSKSSSQININIIEQPIQMTISNTLGEVIYSNNFTLSSSENGLILSTSKLEKGVYLITFYLENGSKVSRKLIVN